MDHLRCLTVSSEIEIVHPAGKPHKQESKHHWLPQVPETEYKYQAPQCQSKQLKLREAKLQRRLSDHQLHARSFKLRHLRKRLSSLLSCLQTVQSDPGSQLLGDVTHAGVGFDAAAVFESFLLLQVTPINLIGSPGQTSVRSVLFRLWLPIGEQTRVFYLSRKSFVTTLQEGRGCRRESSMD